MEVLFFWGVLFVLVFPIVFATIIPLYKQHHAVSGDVINSDAFMRKYVYKAYLSKEEIVRLLQIKNAADELCCVLDPDKSIIIFSDAFTTMEFHLHIQECVGFSIIRLEETKITSESSHIPLKLNPFFVRKLQAEIIPYSQYGL